MYSIAHHKAQCISISNDGCYYFDTGDEKHCIIQSNANLGIVGQTDLLIKGDFGYTILSLPAGGIITNQQLNSYTRLDKNDGKNVLVKFKLSDGMVVAHSQIKGEIDYQELTHPRIISSSKDIVIVVNHGGTLTCPKINLRSTSTGAVVIKVNNSLGRANIWETNDQITSINYFDDKYYFTGLTKQVNQVLSYYRIAISPTVDGEKTVLTQYSDETATDLTLFDDNMLITLISRSNSNERVCYLLSYSHENQQVNWHHRSVTNRITTNNTIMNPQVLKFKNKLVFTVPFNEYFHYQGEQFVGSKSVDQLVLLIDEDGKPTHYLIFNHIVDPHNEWKVDNKYFYCYLNQYVLMNKFNYRFEAVNDIDEFIKI